MIAHWRNHSFQASRHNRPDERRQVPRGRITDEADGDAPCRLPGGRLPEAQQEAEYGLTPKEQHPKQLDRRPAGGGEYNSSNSSQLSVT